MRRRNPEECVQRALVAWLEMCRPDLWFHHTPNGGGRSRAEAGILKATGVKAGVADLQIIDRAGRVLWVEVKAPACRVTGRRAGRLSDSQRDFRAAMEARGHHFAIAWSLDDLQRAIQQWETNHGRHDDTRARARDAA